MIEFLDEPENTEYRPTSDPEIFKTVKDIIKEDLKEYQRCCFVARYPQRYELLKNFRESLSDSLEKNKQRLTEREIVF